MDDAYSHLSESDLISSFGSIFTEPDEDDRAMIERVRSIMGILPSIEADFVDLYFFRHVKQTDIAVIFGVSQPTVCYRLARAIDRIKYYLRVPHVPEEELREKLVAFLPDPLDVSIMVYMYETTCQSETAKRLGVSQGLVRHRFIRSIEKMQADEGMRSYGDIFQLVSENLNIMREVRRTARDSDRPRYVLDA